MPYMDVSVQITAASGWDEYELKGVGLYYVRDKAALTAVPSAQYGYTGSGVVPIEMSQLDGEKPCSTARFHDMHDLAVYLYEHRVGTFLASAHPTSFDTARRILVDVPPTMASTVPAAVWIKASGSSEDITVTTPTGSDTVTVSADQWYEFGVTFALSLIHI